MQKKVVFTHAASSIMRMLEPAEQSEAKQLLDLVASEGNSNPLTAKLIKLKGADNAYALPLGNSLLLVIELVSGQVTLKDVVNRELIALYRGSWQPA
jgi:hypothetical protein